MKIKQLQWVVLLYGIGTLPGCAEFQDSSSPKDKDTSSYDGNTDTGSDSGMDGGTDSDTESYSDGDSDTGSESTVDTETDSDTESGTATDEDIDAGLDGGTDSESEGDSDTGSDSDIDTDTNTVTDTDTNTDTESETDTQPADTTITIQENAVGFCGVDGTIDTNHLNFTGDGFANALNDTKSAITWRVKLEAADTDVQFTWRYAYEYITPDMQRDATLRVDNTVVVTTVSFPVTASWDTWETASASCALSVGEHKVELIGKTSDGMANIDWLRVSNAPVSAVSCGK